MGKRDFRQVFDFSREDIEAVFDLARELKKEVPTKKFSRRMQDCVLAMIFEKPSLRTRCTFEIAMLQMGGSGIYLGPQEIGLGKRESIYDVAKNIERWFDMVMVRTFAQKNVIELAEHCKLPVINALSDDEHPCQAMADFLTILEKRGNFDGLKLAYVGDGNNICHSLVAMTARLGSEIRVATPEGYEPDAEFVKAAQKQGEKTGATIQIGTDPVEAVLEADAVYTDVWASMGQEDEAKERRRHFQPFQVNSDLMANAQEGAWIMHDLPAHRGEEISDEMMDGPNAIVFDQAENRLHVQKAIMVYLLESAS
ncbi:MAG: ornithine carbamoyltransferase [Candidatus Sumerlaeia bacterium]